MNRKASGRRSWVHRSTAWWWAVRPAFAGRPRPVGPRARLGVESLEGRSLMSAALAGMADLPRVAGGSLLGLAAVVRSPHAPDDSGPPVVPVAPPAAAGRTREVVFVDATVPDSAALVGELLAGIDPARRVEVVVLDPAADGVAQVGAHLGRYAGLDAVHLVGHGGAGALHLGGTRLTAADLGRHAAALAGWRAALSADADLLLYGCDVAAGDAGRALVRGLAGLTGADVAASDDRTGGAARGGDWELEFRHGAVEAGALSAGAGWSGVLAVQTLFLKGDTTPPFSPLSSTAPTATALPNYDPGRDAFAGLLVQKGAGGHAETDAVKYHLFQNPVGAVSLGGPATLTFWSAMKDFTTGKTGSVTAYLVDTNASGGSRTLVAQGSVTRANWGGGTWEEFVINFGTVNHTVAASRSLGVVVVVNNGSDDDLWFAYDTTAFPSRLQYTTANGAPAATADAYAVAEDGVLTVAGPGVLANDADPDADALTAVLVTGPAHGSLTLNPGGGFVYTPAADFHGTDQFTYRAADGTAQSPPVTVSVTVTPVNDPPAAAGDAYAVAEDGVLTVAGPGVLANDADPDADPLSAVLVTGPAHGTLTLNPNGGFVYTPAADFHGTDQFTYRAGDGNGGTATATVTVIVNPTADPPAAPAGGTLPPQVATQGSPFTYQVPAFADPDGDALTYAATLADGSALPGWLAFDPATRTLTGTPGQADIGPVTVRVTATDPTGAAAAATVSLTVGDTNDPPAAAGDATVVGQGRVITIDVRAFASDLDGDALTVSAFTQPDHGTLVLGPDGVLVYTPRDDFHGTDRFTYRVTDGALESGTAAVTLIVPPPAPGPRPPAAGEELAPAPAPVVPAGGAGGDAPVSFALLPPAEPAADRGPLAPPGEPAAPVRQDLGDGTPSPAADPAGNSAARGAGGGGGSAAGGVRAEGAEGADAPQPAPAAPAPGGAPPAPAGNVPGAEDTNIPPPRLSDRAARPGGAVTTAPAPAPRPPHAVAAGSAAGAAGSAAGERSDAEPDADAGGEVFISHVEELSPDPDGTGDGGGQLIAGVPDEVVAVAAGAALAGAGGAAHALTARAGWWAALAGTALWRKCLALWAAARRFRR
ncbi:MAG: hypothetical protein C0501_19095 [Isosphaera sp.]|nr:hypothetical protein [Isosphaera sp.]